MTWENTIKGQRPDYPDLDGDGDTDEPMVDALETVEQVESVKKEVINMSWEKKLQKAPELSRTAGWDGIPESVEVSNIDESINHFLNVWKYNRKAAYERQGFTPEEIQETEKAAEKLALAKKEFLEFLKTLDWN